MIEKTKGIPSLKAGLWGGFFLLLVLLLNTSSLAVSETSKKIPEVDLNPMGLTPSGECGKCHQDIYKAWKNSLHAQSANNPVFWAALLQAYFQKGEPARKMCLSCHAPIANLTYDFGLEEPLTHEGINCDYCHSISRVQQTNSEFTVEHQFGLLKQGPLQNVKSPVHETRHNPLYRQSLYCAGCHEFKSPEGIQLIGTYSEWTKSPYPKEGTHCQDCHMRKKPGKIVAPEVVETPETEVSSHDIAGAHSLSLREKSLALEFREIRHHKQKIEVILDITNRAAGHKIPTGLPTKRLILQVAVQSQDGRIFESKRKIYQKLIVDAADRPIRDDTQLLLGKNLRMVSDNRIGPKETRRERFTFFVPADADQVIRATVYYHHTPQLIQRVPIRFKMKEITQILER